MGKLVTSALTGMSALTEGQSRPSRRSVLLGAGGVVASVGAAVVLPAQAALAAAPTTPADVIALAKSYQYNTKSDMDKIWTSKYKPYTQWCADFVSWCMRGTPQAFNAGSQDYYNACTPVSAANVRQGDIVWYYGAGHLGLVRSHSDGLIRTVEGNAHGGQVWFYDQPWDDAIKYARPKY